jgi:hypothetical protein
VADPQAHGRIDVNQAGACPRPARVWIVARMNIDDGLRGGHVRTLAHGIESGMKREAKGAYRVDVVPIGEAQPASS